MKPAMLIVALLLTRLALYAQQVDSIYFHLYTDSLKKGTYNYINVDGKLNNNQWLPLTAKEIQFSATEGRFEGNSLFIDSGFTGEKITVKAVLKANPALTRQITIYIKKITEDIFLYQADTITGQKTNAPLTEAHSYH